MTVLRVIRWPIWTGGWDPLSNDDGDNWFLSQLANRCRFNASPSCFSFHGLQAMMGSEVGNDFVVSCCMCVCVWSIPVDDNGCSRLHTLLHWLTQIQSYSCSLIFKWLCSIVDFILYIDDFKLYPKKKNGHVRAFASTIAIFGEYTHNDVDHDDDFDGNRRHPLYPIQFNSIHFFLFTFPSCFINSFVLRFQ